MHIARTAGDNAVLAGVFFGTDAPPAPSNVQAVAAGGQVALSWDPVATATGYDVYRSGKGKGDRKGKGDIPIPFGTPFAPAMDCGALSRFAADHAESSRDLLRPRRFVVLRFLIRQRMLAAHG